MNLNNIKVGFDAAKNFGKAQKLGAQYADDAFRNADTARQITSNVTGVGDATTAANFYNQRAQYMNDFIEAYAGAKPVYASKEQQVGRAIAGATDAVGNLGGAVLNNPMGQMALFSAPMLVPIVSGGGGEQQQLTPQEMQYLQQQQAMQRGGYG